MARGLALGQRAIQEPAALLDLHIHDVGIGLDHAVAHVQRGLKANLRFLHRHHGFFQADGGVFHLHFALQAGRFVLCGADRVQCAFQRGGKAGVVAVNAGGGSAPGLADAAKG